MTEKAKGQRQELAKNLLEGATERGIQVEKVLPQRKPDPPVVLYEANLLAVFRRSWRQK